MAGDDVPAKLVAHLERAFEVQPRARLPLARRRPRPGFGRDVDVEPVRSLVDHRQAHARTGDGRAERDAAHVVSAANAQPQVAPRLAAAISPMSVTIPVNICGP
jgi:hypothetical protein